MDAACAAMLGNAKMPARTFVLEFLPSMLQVGPITCSEPMGNVIKETLYKNFLSAQEAYLVYLRRLVNRTAYTPDVHKTQCDCCAARLAQNVC